MPTSGFDPPRHGFAFANTFENRVLTLPGGHRVTTQGRCGGMAFAALDYYYAGLPVPTIESLPPDGSLLADYIYRRLLDSFALNGARFVMLTLAPDQRTWLSSGLGHITAAEELPRLRAQVDEGTPVVLGLIAAGNLFDIGNNHQVLACAHDTDAGAARLSLHDNNYPRALVSLTGQPDGRSYLSSSGQRWRGFFVERYTPARPEFLIDGTLLKDASLPQVYVVYGGAKFSIPSTEVFTTLGLEWDRLRVVGDGSMAHIADIPADGTLLREHSTSPAYVIEAGTRRFIPSQASFEQHGFRWADLHVVPDGALAALPEGAPLPEAVAA